MQIQRAVLDEAELQGVLNQGQGSALWAYLNTREQQSPAFRPAHILYYLGGLIAIGAMTLFMTLGWQRFGASSLLVISLCYAALAIGMTEALRKRPAMALPAGVGATFALVMVPMAVYAVQNLLGLWPANVAHGMAYRDYHTVIDGRWLAMEGITLVAAALALWRYRYPFLVLPVAVTLWYMSMDLAPFLFGGQPVPMMSAHAQWVSLWFGLVMLLIALLVDLRSRMSQDFAFWLYLFGVLTFWGGLTSMESHSELGKLGYCILNLLMIGVGAALGRRVFAVFGGFGVALYLGHLSHTVFKDSMLFPVALTAIGLLVVVAGVLWQRHEEAIGVRLRGFLPAAVRRVVEQRAA